MMALISLTLRLLTPVLGDYRSNIEQWASELIRQPIAIQSIEAKMVGFSLQLDLAGVEFLDADRQESVARFDGLSIHVGILNSLMNRMFILDYIELHGLDVALVKDEDGAISIHGMGGGSDDPNGGGKIAGDETEQARKGIERWLLQQGRISLHRSRIRWSDIAREQQFDFSDVSIKITNSGSDHSIYSLVELPDEVGGELEVEIRLTGDVVDSKSWRGAFYLRGDDLNSQLLFGSALPKDWQIREGGVDGEFWGDIVAGKLSQMQGRIRAKAVELAYREREMPLSNFDLQLRLSGGAPNWKLQLSRINFDGPLRGKLPHYIQLQQEANGWRLNLDQFNLAALLPVVSVLKPELLEPEAKLRGDVHAIELHYDEGLDSLGATLERMEISGVVGLPSISGLNAVVELRHGVASAAIKSPEVTLNIPQIFKAALPSLAMEGTISATWDSERWQLWSDQIELKNGDIDLNVAANLQSRPEQSPHVAISADIDVKKVNHLRHYIPDNILGKGSVNWLRDAFHSGVAEGGKILVVGSGRDIVDRAKGGRMEIALFPAAVDLNFHKSWPRINDIDAALRFSGRKMVINSSKGAILTTGRVKRVVVQIADFREPKLTVDGLASFSATDGIDYISQSPLKNILGNVGGAVEANGAQEIELQLAIPLKKENGKIKKATISGVVDFNKVSLNIDKSIEITEIIGGLVFNQHGVKKSTFKAEIFQSPINVSVYRQQKGAKKSTVISAKGRLAFDQIGDKINRTWGQQLSGETPWQGVVEFNHAKKSGVVTLNSDLKGLKSGLPHPLNKKRKSSVPLSVNYQFAGGDRKVAEISLGKRLYAKVGLAKRGGGLKDLYINFGGGKNKNIKHSGVFITGRLSQLDIASLLALLPTRDSSQSKSPFELPIIVAMKSLHILNKKENNIQQDTAVSRIEPSSIPPLQIEINAIRYGDLKLGGVTLVTRRSKNGLTIKKLVVSDGNHRLRASGSWNRLSGSQLDLKLSAKDMGKMLKTLQFKTPMERGELTAEGKLKWPDSPINFELAKVSGSFKMRVNEGLIKDANTGTGQLLGLLNVGKIFNRVFLDFSDVKGNDLSYKYMSGNFRIARGSIHTDNYLLKSAQADLRLTGRIGLVDKDFDSYLSVIPQLSDAVPVAGLMFGPQVAVALQALNRLFGKALDKGVMQRYQISGGWADPEIKKLKPKTVKMTND